MSNIQSKNIKIVAIDKIVPNPKNPNAHPPEQIERLAKIIDYQGFRNPLVVSKRTGFLVVGHGRLEAAKKLGRLKELPVMEQDFESEAQEYAYLVSDNAIADWAQLDLSGINQNIIDQDFDLDIDLLGIKDFELIEAEKYDEDKQDEVPDVTHDPVTKLGDVWILGEHRVMCGDSTMIDEVDRLMNGEKADMVFTDPPYGINEKCDRDFASRTHKAKANSFNQIKGDENTDVAISAVNLLLGLQIEKYVILGANYFCHTLPETAEWLAWDKREEDKERDVNSDIELAWVKSGKKSARIFRHKWKGMIKASEHGQSRVHPTQKPIALAEWCINEYKAGDNVLDVFLGSGSTLIACEKTNRKCYGMELDPHYCDVICHRWSQFTGKNPILESTGEKFSEIVNKKTVN